MAIRIRESFEDIPSEVAYVQYVPYKTVPTCEDYVYGKKGSIILRNVHTGELEQINYRLVGAMPFITRSGYQSFWGEIQPKECNCCLAFDFALDGRLQSITASFCGKSPSSSELDKMNEKITYGAQITAVGDFGPIPF